jgi:hypothetical protein
MENKDFSLGKLDIVDLYEWHTTEKLQYRTYFQRQFVWRQKDREELIDTIIKKLPMPAIFLCDANTDFVKLQKVYNVLDGRQRLESIFGFLEGKFKYHGKLFAELDDATKQDILSYSIALVQMYIDPEDTTKIKEIFKRLNKSAYNLNKIERQSSQLVEYDFMKIAKIVTGIIQIQNVDDYLKELDSLFPNEDLDTGDELKGEVSPDDVSDEDSMDPSIKQICDLKNISTLQELFSDRHVFSSYEWGRQVSLQYFLNMFAAVVNGEHSTRNVTESAIVELSEKPKDEIEEKLILFNKAGIILLSVYSKQIDKFWKNKTSFFTLLVLFTKEYSTIKTLNECDIVTKLNDFKISDTAVWREYLGLSQEGVNERTAREKRERILRDICLG